MIALTYHDGREIYVRANAVVLIERAKDGVEGSTVYFSEDAWLSEIGVLELPQLIAERVKFAF